ncbi:hypothetical protein [uncultured Acetatifactor sp.]|jgi:hypothetical protein|uniref:hypothetical protein n=1 Tax=uncultured Acetatifactor sp. TaxID=1671927 RepID=UPI0025E0E94A|nr:hypothetical protein [uncultured Acetatifactor sp.]
MKKLKKMIASPVTTIAAFAVAAGLLLFSSIGGARAALTYFSDDYAANIQLHEIGVTLVENGAPVEGELLKGLLAEGEELKLGTAYQEQLNVYNSGVINEYVRVSIHKYWVDSEGEKIRTLSPELIGLNLVNLGTDWLIDQEASTRERTVLYYNKLLASQSETPLFADKLTIDGSIADRVGETRETSGGYTTITVTYEYDGARFCIEAKVDGVQEHNAQDAIWSAWGRRVTIDNGVLSLN